MPGKNSSSFFIGGLFSLLIIFFLVSKIEAFKDWRWGKPISSDVIYYYEYLPAKFIYDDITLKFTDSQSNDVRSRIWYLTLPNGNRLIKTTMGVSIFLAPAFLVTHAIADDLGYPANGYSLPYFVSVIASSVLFSFLSLLILIKILRRFFPYWVVILTILTIYLGTNLFIYITTEPGMSHIYSFFLFCAFIELTISWYDRKTLFRSVLLGLTFGLIALVRPTNVLIGLFFLLYNVTSIRELRTRGIYLLKNYGALLIMAVCAFLVWVPQMLYWKQITGDHLFFSYSPGERFFFDRPRIIPGLFSYHKGWLLYTPVMVLAIKGIFFIYRKHKGLFWAIIAFLPINIYIIFSWWCWWYGGSFGQRPMIDCYPLLSLPLAAFIHQFKGSFKPAIVVILLAGFIYLNQLQSAQYRSGAIHWDAMSKEAYWKGFGKVTKHENLQEMLKPIDYEAAMRGEYKSMR